MAVQKEGIMRIRTIPILVTVFVLFTVLGVAQKPVHWDVTGSVTLLGRDMATGVSEGVIGMCGGKGTFGRHSCNTFVRSQMVGFDTELCPGLPEYRWDVYSHIQRFRNGDLLYQQLKPGGANYMCADPFVENKFWGRISTEFVGGTGRFESATGEVEWEIVEGNFLDFDPVTGSGAFAGIITELDGYIFLNGD
jgi:hypothetical protein